MKAHLSVLLALLALVKVADYWLQRYELTLSTRGTVDGALFTDVKAQLPATYLLLMIAVLSMALLIVNIWRRGWVLPVLAVGLWGFVAVVAGGIYPSFIQRFRVEPAESSREAPYIERNIEATRAAMGLAEVSTRPFDYNEDLDLPAAAGQRRDGPQHPPARPGRRHRHLPAAPGRAALLPLQRPRRRPLRDRRRDDPGRDLGPRAQHLGHPAAVLGGPAPGVHPRVRRGRGPGQRRHHRGPPRLRPRRHPRRQRRSALDVDQPGIYVGENLDGYSIVGATRDEIDYQTAGGETVDQPVRRLGRGGHELVVAAGGVRPALRRDRAR